MGDKWRHFFEFSKQERVGLLVFSVLMGAFLLAPRLMYEWHPPPEEEKDWRRVMQTMVTDSTVLPAASERNEIRVAGQNDNSASLRLRPFDPHQLTVSEWVNRGIPEKTAHTIVRYISKGGRFRRATDLYKIWGIRKADVERLMPYVNIPDDENYRRELPPVRKSALPEKSPLRVININQADSAAWTSLPGIGPVFARRIVRFRERMGGFQSMTDLRRVYGLSDSLFQQILPFLLITPRPLDTAMLNQFSIRQLMSRLSINYEMAQAIVVYRRQTGRFQQLEDLKKIVFIPDSLYLRITGYNGQN